MAKANEPTTTTTAPVTTTANTPSYEMSAKVTDKGGISVYGLQKFPVTLYADQWLAILGNAEKLKAFIKNNQAHLKSKPVSSGGPIGSVPL